jgi:hypothetical protein
MEFHVKRNLLQLPELRRPFCLSGFFQIVLDSRDLRRLPRLPALHSMNVPLPSSAQSARDLPHAPRRSVNGRRPHFRLEGFLRWLRRSTSELPPPAKPTFISDRDHFRPSASARVRRRWMGCASANRPVATEARSRACTDPGFPMDYGLRTRRPLPSSVVIIQGTQASSL